jgi:phage terminase small subunit
VKALINGENLKDVAISTGLSPKTAGSQATNILKHPQALKTFIRYMEENGISDDFLAAKIYNLINAKKTEYFQKDGIVTDQREVEALETQRKTLELATKLKGHLKDQSQVDVNIGIMAMVVAAVKGEGKE